MLPFEKVYICQNDNMSQIFNRDIWCSERHDKIPQTQIWTILICKNCQNHMFCENCLLSLCFCEQCLLNISKKEKGKEWRKCEVKKMTPFLSLPRRAPMKCSSTVIFHFTRFCLVFNRRWWSLNFLQFLWEWIGCNWISTKIINWILRLKFKMV